MSKNDDNNPPNGMDDEDKKNGGIDDGIQPENNKESDNGKKTTSDKKPRITTTKLDKSKLLSKRPSKRDKQIDSQEQTDLNGDLSEIIEQQDISVENIPVQIEDQIGQSKKVAKKQQRDKKDARNFDNTKFVKVQVEDEMKKSFIAYAMAVNISRAIPDVRDGLKPVHRRILYAMSELNLYSDKQYRKCARIVGDVLGKYHPHGDSAVYQALVRLAQDFSIRYPLVDGHGNFGSMDGDPAAAQRYTEAKLSKIAGEMLRDIDKDTVDYYPNFDDTIEQPTVLPSRIPNLLINGSDGIAVGMATNIPPHNLTEVIQGLFALIDNPEITIEELMAYIPAPDYPTGGVILGRTNIKRAYRTGHGGVVCRAKAEIEEYGGRKGQPHDRQRIVITELPYQVNKAALITQIAELSRDKRIDGIADIHEESDREGLRVVVDIKRDAQAQTVLNQLYKHSNLQISNGITFLALVNEEPKVLNLKEMLYYYLEHQKDVVVRRTKYDLEKAEERSHILQGLVIALANIDRVIAIIKQSRDKFEAAEGLTAEFYLTDKQANAILEMRLSRLTSLEVEQLNNEFNELQIKIADLKDILSTPTRVLEIIKAEMTIVKEKFGDERRTRLEVDYEELDAGDMIDVEDVVISMTHSGYIKRLPTTEYRTQNRAGRGSSAHKPKDEDFVEKVFVANTHSDILFFSNFGKVYSIKGYHIPEANKATRGRAIVNLFTKTRVEKNADGKILRTEEVCALDRENGEKITAVIPLPQESRKGYLMLATRNGKIKRTHLEHFESINKSGKIAILLNPGDELISAQLTGGRDEILVATNHGKCIRFAEDNVRAQGRNSQGQRSIKLNNNKQSTDDVEDDVESIDQDIDTENDNDVTKQTDTFVDTDYVVDMTVLQSGHELLTISEKGFGKRSDPEEYRLQRRGGKGVSAGTFNNKTGKLVGLKQLSEDNDIMIIADDGTLIRIRAKDVSKIKRGTQGVRIMRLKGNKLQENMSKAIQLGVSSTVEKLFNQYLDVVAKTQLCAKLKSSLTKELKAVDDKLKTFYNNILNALDEKPSTLTDKRIKSNMNGAIKNSANPTLKTLFERWTTNDATLKNQLTTKITSSLTKELNNANSELKEFYNRILAEIQNPDRKITSICLAEHEDEVEEIIDGSDSDNIDTDMDNEASGDNTTDNEQDNQIDELNQNDQPQA